MTDSVYKYIHNYISVLFERFCINWHPDQRDGTTRLRAMAALSWLSSQFRP